MLRVNNWDEIFENNRSREIQNLTYVCVPNRHDGSKFLDLMDHEHGAEHFAAWVLIVQLASRCGNPAGTRGIPAGGRGVLRRGDGTPHTPRSMSLSTRCPEK